MMRPFPIVNVDSQAIPPFGVVMPFGGLDGDNLLKVKRPTADSMPNVYFNGPNEVQPGDAGQAFSPECVAKYTGTIAAGDKLGTAANAWLLDKTKTGFVFLDGKNGIGNVDRDYSVSAAALDIHSYRVPDDSPGGTYCPGCVFGNYQTTLVATANKAFVLPLILPLGGTLADILFYLNGAGSSAFKGRVAIYKTDDLTNPTSLVLDSGDILLQGGPGFTADTDAFNGVSMSAGAYLIGVVFNTSLPVIGGAKTDNMFSLYGMYADSNSFKSIFGFSGTMTYGAWPSTLAGYTALGLTIFDGSVTSVPVPFLDFYSFP